MSWLTDPDGNDMPLVLGIPTDVALDRALSALAVRLWLVKDAERGAAVDDRAIADFLGVSERDVNNAVVELYTAGYVTLDPGGWRRKLVTS